MAEEEPIDQGPIKGKRGKGATYRHCSCNELGNGHDFILRNLEDDGGFHGTKVESGSLNKNKRWELLEDKNVTVFSEATKKKSCAC